MVDIEIKIQPDKDQTVTFSSGVKLPIAAIQLTHRKVAKRAWLRTHPKEQEFAIIIRSQKYSSKKSAGTNAIAGAIFEDGTLLVTNHYWNYQDQHIPKFLRELEMDILNGFSLIGKICNRCVFCSKPLTTTKSLERGFGAACAKTFSLEAFDVYMSGINGVITGTSSTIRNAFHVDEVEPELRAREPATTKEITESDIAAAKTLVQGYTQATKALKEKKSSGAVMDTPKERESSETEEDPDCRPKEEDYDSEDFFTSPIVWKGRPNEPEAIIISDDENETYGSPKRKAIGTLFNEQKRCKNLHEIMV
jgi:hypothetical protein